MFSTACCTSLKLLNKAIGPKLTSLLSLPFPYLDLSAFLKPSKLRSKYLFNKLITESSLGILIYIWLLGVYVVELLAGLNLK